MNKSNKKESANEKLDGIKAVVITIFLLFKKLMFIRFNFCRSEIRSLKHLKNQDNYGSKT